MFKTIIDNLVVSDGKLLEFYATVIKVRGLASYKTRFNPPFLHKNGCTIRNMTVVINLFGVFERLILPFH